VPLVGFILNKKPYVSYFQVFPVNILTYIQLRIQIKVNSSNYNQLSTIQNQSSKECSVLQTSQDHYSDTHKNIATSDESWIITNP
jgi:hypothetical protein